MLPAHRAVPMGSCQSFLKEMQAWCSQRVIFFKRNIEIFM